MAVEKPMEAAAPHTEVGSPLRPTPVEIASGCIFGAAAAPLGSNGLRPGTGPLEAMAQAIRPGLERPPCLVSFSGGRDSSAVLAVAARTARREGLPLPVPVTLRFPAAPRTAESHWQEQVVRHLRLGDWHRESPDDLDFVGPVAGEVLRRHGVLWPPNAFLYAPMLARARGGSLLTGLGGDQVLGGWRHASLGELRAGRRPPRIDDPLRLLGAAAPPSVRALVERRPRLGWWSPTWLRPAVRRWVARAQARELASQPARYDRWLSWLARRRELEAMRWSLDLLAGAELVRLSHPFLDRGFLAALARAGARDGFGDRDGSMQVLFESVLPPELLRRRDKAEFGEVFWGESSRAFVDRWPGTGGDEALEALIDARALRAAWAERTPDARSAMLLQRLWLRGDTERERVDSTLASDSLLET